MFVCVGGRVGKMYVKYTNGEGGLLETYESVQRGKGVKNCQTWMDYPKPKTIATISIKWLRKPYFDQMTGRGLR